MAVSDIAIKTAVNQFFGALATIPGANVKLMNQTLLDRKGGDGASCGIDLLFGQKSLTLFVEEKKDIYPRDARDLIWKSRVRRSGATLVPGETVTVLVADYISEAAKKLLQQEGCGYYDGAGSMYLPAPGAFIWIHKPAAKAPARNTRKLFAGMRAQVLHAALMSMNQAQWFGVGDIARLARVSASTASEVLAQLDRHGWTDSRGGGPSKLRQLVGPSALLNAWVAESRDEPMPASRHYLVPLTDGQDLISVIANVFSHCEVRHGITGEATSGHYAPGVTPNAQVQVPVQVRALPSPALETALSELGARQVTAGANLCIIESVNGGELLFLESDAGATFVSPIIAYLDLMRSEGRGQDIAQCLRTERIRL